MSPHAVCHPWRLTAQPRPVVEPVERHLSDGRRPGARRVRPLDGFESVEQRFEFVVGELAVEDRESDLRPRALDAGTTISLVVGPEEPVRAARLDRCRVVGAPQRRDARRGRCSVVQELLEPESPVVACDHSPERRRIGVTPGRLSDLGRVERVRPPRWLLRPKRRLAGRSSRFGVGQADIRASCSPVERHRWLVRYRTDGTRPAYLFAERWCSTESEGSGADRSPVVVGTLVPRGG